MMKFNTQVLNQGTSGRIQSPEIEINGFSLKATEPASPRTQGFFESCGAKLEYKGGNVILTGGTIRAEQLRAFQLKREQDIAAAKLEQSNQQNEPVFKALNGLTTEITEKPWKNESKTDTFWLRCTADKKVSIEQKLNTVGLTYKISKVKESADLCIQINGKDVEKLRHLSHISHTTK